MGPALRILIGACLWSIASGLATQADPTPARLRAQQIVSATKSGQEDAVPCSRIEGAGEALLELGQDAAAKSADRALVPLRLAIGPVHRNERLLAVR